MKKIAVLTAALLLTAGFSQASLAQGRGHDKGEGQGDCGDHKKGGGHDKHEARGPERGDGVEAGPGKGKGRGQADGKAHADKTRKTVIVRESELRPERHLRIVELNRYGERGPIAGCPPGLAKRNNGCMPPGQERKLARPRYESLWGRPADGYSYRYNEGYLYHYNRQGGLLGYLPALGGALGIGNLWPDQYRYDPMPQYYSRYYQLNDTYDYRYADGAVYGVDPKNSAIKQVVALLTGQQFSVGQQMPSGYDAYNVPYAYRDRYSDTRDREYRYNDGYVYQVDPTTRLVQAVIQLLT